MKRLMSFFIMLTFLLAFSGCSKDKNLTLKIVSPVEGQKIIRGIVVQIEINAKISKGGISKVKIYIDDTLRKTTSKEPIGFKWLTAYTFPGSHNIKAMYYCDSGDSISDQVNVEIIDNEIGPTTYTDPRDGHVYKIVGEDLQVWFMENLAYDTGINFYYDNNIENGNQYGRLYDWETAQTACPPGWHLPSDSEWKNLETLLGMSFEESDKVGYRGNDEGTQLKADFGWKNEGNGNNYSWFTALPGGIYNSKDAMFKDIKEAGTWWTSTKVPDNSEKVWGRSLSWDHEQVNRLGVNKTDAASVRCIKSMY